MFACIGWILSRTNNYIMNRISFTNDQQWDMIIGPRKAIIIIHVTPSSSIHKISLTLLHPPSVVSLVLWCGLGHSRAQEYIDKEFLVIYERLCIHSILLR